MAKVESFTESQVAFNEIHSDICRCFVGSQAREAGQVLTQEVESLSARLAMVTSLSLADANRLAKEVGILTDVCMLFHSLPTDLTDGH